MDDKKTKIPTIKLKKTKSNYMLSIKIDLDQLIGQLLHILRSNVKTVHGCIFQYMNDYVYNKHLCLL